MSIIEAKAVTKIYSDTASAVEVLKGVDFTLGDGDAVAIYGASGSGKSTLLHILGGLDRPNDGSVSVCGKELASLADDDLAEFRNHHIGFVFQFYHLLPEFTAVENAMLPALISGTGTKKAREMAMAALEAVDLLHRADHRPSMLSGGEQQRAAIARASVMRPSIILADEPTGNLDRDTGDAVWRYLLSLRENYGISLVIATHNIELAKDISKSYVLKDGLLSSL
jgi:lipoprotein-releasing system ATP-binding protein